MADHRKEPPIRADEPRKPLHSLPLYTEPTPETHRRISREEEAELALKNSRFTRGTRPLIIILFLATIASVPIVQLSAELRSSQREGGLPIFGVFRVLPDWAQIRAARGVSGLWALLPRAQEIKAAEKTLEQESVVSQWLLPRVQYALSTAVHAGNEQVYPGRNGWLFYRDDVDYVIGAPFLNAARMAERSRKAVVQPDPVRAIIDFRNQLAKRGIDFVAMPVPVKASIDSEELSARAPEQPLQNASFAQFTARLEEAGVRVFDPAPFLMKRKKNTGGAPLYLQTDTHWRPETMEFVAQKLAAFLGPVDQAGETKTSIVEKEITASGDIAAMLKLPPQQSIYRPQTVTIHQVANGNEWWRPSKDADLLLLGDSFSNIFSFAQMGWGESAGFAEQLSVALGGRPIDCIVRNSDAAFATREILSHELARGRDRLAGKKTLVWEFAARELSFGNWKLFSLQIGPSRPAQVFSPPPHTTVTASGTVESISAVPRPGTVPYKDHIVALHLVDMVGPPQAETTELQAIVYLWSMQDNQWTRAARLRPNDRITVRLRAWSDVAPQYEKFNRSEMDHPTLQLEEAVWGELVN